LTDKELKEIIKKNPNSIVAAAYRLGKKDLAVSISPSVEKLFKK
jgi:hypothetical protein